MSTEYRVIPYRNMHGDIIPKGLGVILVQKKPKRKRVKVSIDYILCPQTEGLKHIDLCRECPFYAGIEKGVGIRCKNMKQFTPHPAYNQTLTKDIAYGNKD